MLTKHLEAIRDRSRWLEVAFCLFWGLVAQLSTKFMVEQARDRAVLIGVLGALALAVSGYSRMRRGYWLVGKNRMFDLYMAALKVIITVWLFTGIFRDYYGTFLSDDGVAAVATLAVCVMIFVAPKKDLLVTRLHPSNDPAG